MEWVETCKSLLCYDETNQIGPGLQSTKVQQSFILYRMWTENATSPQHSTKSYKTLHIDASCSSLGDQMTNSFTCSLMSLSCSWSFWTSALLVSFLPLFIIAAAGRLGSSEGVTSDTFEVSWAKLQGFGSLLPGREQAGEVKTRAESCRASF